MPQSKEEKYTAEDFDRIRNQFNDLAELAGSLAHEIKNPLSVIRMNMDLLADDLADSAIPEMRRNLRKVQTVQNQCTRLENLLNDFLKLAKLNPMDLKAGSLNREIEKVLDFYEAEAAHNKIEIIRYLDSELPSIMLDPYSLQSALVNLVKNAIEAMPEGGQLMVRTRSVLDGVALDLIDTGEGMSDNTLVNMFNVFYTTKDGGSGLGLPTAKKIIESHGGRINVLSTVGRGTQFTLVFPVPKRIG
jgi:signal transduction histidine kinase